MHFHCSEIKGKESNMSESSCTGSTRKEDNGFDASQLKHRTYGQVFSKFADKTSMQGVGYIKQSKLLIAKIIWSFLLLLSIVALSVHLWYSLTQFYSYPKTAKMNLGFANLPFPDITICNVNPVSKRHLEEYKSTRVDTLKAIIEALNPENVIPKDELDPDTDYPNPGGGNYPYGDGDYPNGGEIPYNGGNYPYGNGDSPYDGGYPSGPIDTKTPPPPKPKGKKPRKKRYAKLFDKYNCSNYDPDFEDWFQQDKASVSGGNGGKLDSETKIHALFRKQIMSLTRSERATLGHNITNMLLKCTFAGRLCGDTRNLFRLHQNPDYGNCWTLLASNFTARDSGPSAGLSLVLNLQSKDYVKSFTHGYGARIQIHNRGAYPDPSPDGFDIPASMETNIGLKLVTFERLSGKYGNCEDGAEFQRLYNRPYTRRTCQTFCYANKLMDTCGCYNEYSEEVAVATERYDHLPACNTSKQYRCLHKIEEEFQMKDVSCSCLNPCRESAYTKSITSHQWPTDEYAKLLVAGVCEQDVEECKDILTPDETRQLFMHNFLKLNIYYEDLNYEEIQEEADIEIAQILSDVGGAIGLWIGLSVVSFCEILQLIVELVKLTRHKMTESRRERRRKRFPKRKLDNVAFPREIIHLEDAIFTNFDCTSEVDSNDSSSAYGSFTSDETGNVVSVLNWQLPYNYNRIGHFSRYPVFGGIQRQSDRNFAFAFQGHAAKVPRH